MPIFVVVLILVLFKVSKYSITRDLEAPSVNACIILFLSAPQERSSRRRFRDNSSNTFLPKWGQLTLITVSL